MNIIPKISVLLPVYNAEAYIDEAIKSVLNQSFKDFELIIINDGSTDDSLARIQHYAQLDDRCLVHSTENSGIVKSLNFGVNLARADIICRMDADDICMPQRLEKQFEYLNKHPECVAVGSNVLLIDPEGMPIVTWKYPNRHEEIDNLNLTGSVGSCICHPSVAIKKSSFIMVGAYRTNFEYAEDYALFLRLAEVGKLANLPDVLLKYRQHSASIGHVKRKQQLMVTQEALEEALLRRGLPLNHALNADFIKNYVPPTSQDTFIKWAWWALSEKYYSTSFKYGFKALKLNFFNIKTYSLLACIARNFVLKK